MNRWFLLPTVTETQLGQETRLPKYREQFDRFSTFYHEPQSKFILRGYGSESALDAVSNENDTQSATTSEVVTLLENRTDRSWSAAEVEAAWQSHVSN